MSYFYDKEQYFEYIEQNSNKEVTCVVLDIDNSKELFGITIPNNLSDFILMLLADRFKSPLSKIGRDCYSFMIDNSNMSLFEVVEKLKDISNDVSNTFKIKLTFCIGIANSQKTDKHKKDLFSLAYESLLSAKNKGPNMVEVYEEESMKLKSIYFRHSQLKQLNNLSKIKNQNESWIIRKALDEYIKREI